MWVLHRHSRRGTCGRSHLPQCEKISSSCIRGGRKGGIALTVLQEGERGSVMRTLMESTHRVGALLQWSAVVIPRCWAEKLYMSPAKLLPAITGCGIQAQEGPFLSPSSLQCFNLFQHLLPPCLLISPSCPTPPPACHELLCEDVELHVVTGRELLILSASSSKSVPQPAGVIIDSNHFSCCPTSTETPQPTRR